MSLSANLMRTEIDQPSLMAPIAAAMSIKAPRLAATDAAFLDRSYAAVATAPSIEPAIQNHVVIDAAESTLLRQIHRTSAFDILTLKSAVALKLSDGPAGMLLHFAGEERALRILDLKAIAIHAPTLEFVGTLPDLSAGGDLHLVGDVFLETQGGLLPLPGGAVTLSDRVHFLVEEHNSAVTDLRVSFETQLQSVGPAKFSLEGADANLFKVSAQGQLSFLHAPDHQVRKDANGDGHYDLTVVATNAKSGQFFQRDVSVGVQLVQLQGSTGDDEVKSGRAWDVIDGMAGNDRLIGGAGLDQFIISAGDDTVADLNRLGQGVIGSESLWVATGATVTATLSSSWAATSESVNHGQAKLLTKGFDVNLAAITGGDGWTVQAQGKLAVHLTGSAHGDTLTGSTGSDTLFGGDGDDLISGGKGADELLGGDGFDTFVISQVNGGKSVDHIADFQSGFDHIQLEGLMFKAPLGTLAADQFALGAAQDANDRVIYDSQSGKVYWDADGVGRKAAVLVVQLNSLDQLLASDILIG
jgi:RTX calcium-binding nonapeptide repeat (4 copies)